MGLGGYTEIGITQATPSIYQYIYNSSINFLCLNMKFI